MPKKLWIEMEGLEKKFLQLSWKLHPDNFVNATKWNARFPSSAAPNLNDAYRTLRDPVGRVEIPPGHRRRTQGRREKTASSPGTSRRSFRPERIAGRASRSQESGGDLTALRESLEAARDNFQAKLTEVDAQLQSAAHEWDAALAGDAATRKKSWRGSTNC